MFKKDIMAMRQTRQTAKKLNDSLTMYNFTPDDECVKLNFSSPREDKKRKHSNDSSLQKVSFNYGHRNISRRHKPAITKELKSPKFEFFSSKLGKSRRSDSGVFMTPSPLLKDTSNLEKSPSQIYPANIIRGDVRKTAIDLQKCEQNVKDNIEPKLKQKTVTDKKCNKEKNNTHHSAVHVGTNSKSSHLYEQLKSPKSKLKETRNSALSSNSDASRENKQMKKRVPISSTKLKKNFGRNIHGQRRLSTNKQKTLRSTLRSQRDEPLQIGNRIKKKANTKFSIQALVEKSNQQEMKKIREKIKLAPTSTPNVVLRQRRKGQAESEGIDMVSPPKVSPVQRSCEELHGQIITSPNNTATFCSPPLKRSTRSSAKDVNTPNQPDFSAELEDSKKEKVVEKNKKSNIKETAKLGKRKLRSQSPMHSVNNKSLSPESNKENRKVHSKPAKKQLSEIKDNAKSTLTKHQHFKVNQSKKRKLIGPESGNKSSVPDKKNKTEEAERKLSLNLFEEFSPVKEKVKRKSPKAESSRNNSPIVDKVEKNTENVDVAVNEVDTAECSILDISKTYKDSFVKKSKGRYSTSKMDTWAQIKNAEFDDLDNYELSMD